jgi:4-hydroxy-tetrahydrodipicolinate reductase
MNIGLIGYGKMGKAIEQIATDRGHVISTIVDVSNKSDLSQITKSNVDVAIEFSEPGAAFHNISACIENGVPVVSGTTGWHSQLDQIKEKCIANNGTFITSTNFSLGVNIFFKLNEWLSKVMNNQSDYIPKMQEIHHLQKLDKPSGTAITLAKGLISSHKGYDHWTLDESVDQTTFTIEALRKPDVPGTHLVTYTSAIDQIEIKHTAFNRQGFALGAVVVAEWIKDKKGVLTMNDFINI